MAEQRFFHDQYNLRRQQFTKLRDCFEGQDAIRDRGTEYLPRLSGMETGTEGDSQYASYKNRTTYYSVLERTLRALLGIVFRVPPALELPEKLEPYKNAITSEADSLHESVRNTVLETLHMGRHGLMLDLPQTESTEARPYVAHYAAEDVTDWREEVINGAKKPVMIMLRDGIRDGDEKDTERFRELLLVDGVYKQRCWKIARTKGADGKTTTEPVVEEEITPLIQGKPLNYIPFWFVGPYSNKPTLEKSPMLDLANESLNHYQIGADWRQALHMLAQPTPYIASDALFQDDSKTPTKIGAGAFWVLPGDARVDMLEYSGAGTRDLHDALIKSENMMAALGAKLIHRGRGPETAEATRVKARDEISVVESTVMSVEDAYRDLLRTMAEWLGVDPELVNFGMDRDFIEERLDASMLAGLIKACFEDKAISRTVFHANLQRGGIIATSRSLDDELEDGATGKAANDGSGTRPEGTQGGDRGAGTPAGDDADGGGAGGGAAQGQQAASQTPPQGQTQTENSIGGGADAEPLNGAQVTSLQGVVQSVADGKLPSGAAKTIIRNAFKAISPNDVESMINEAEAFEPKAEEQPGDPGASPRGAKAQE